MTAEHNKNTDSGLPDIATQDKWKVIAILICVVIFVLICAGSQFFGTQGQPKVSHTEETYAVSNDIPATPKPMVPQEKEVAANNKAPETTVDTQQQLAFLQEKQRELQQRLSAPLLVINGTQGGNATAGNQPASNMKQDQNMQFMDQLSEQNTAATFARPLSPLQYLVAEGHLIHAVLESATDSDLPGFLRAVVSMPVYAEDGSQVLIPAGSRLIGQYKSGMLEGQSRIFIVWTRIIIHGGISVQLGSTGIDSLGVAGVGADEVNRHFWQRFGTASLLSMIGAGAANAGVNGDMQDNSASAYRSAVASSFSQSASQTMQHDSMIAPTLKTHQGKPIMVFVARDLNFQHVMNNKKNKLKIF